MNSSRSAGVRCCQWGPRARRAVSATSNTSLAILRTAARRSWRRSGALRAGSSSTFCTALVYSRTWSVGGPAQARTTAPRVTSTALSRAHADFMRISSSGMRALLGGIPSQYTLHPSCPMSTTPRFPTITEDRLAALRARIGQPVPRPEPYIEVASRDAIRHWAHGIGDRNPFWRTHGVAPPTILFALDRIVSGYVGGLPG